VRLIGDIAYPLTGERGGVVLCFHEVDPARFTRWVEALVQRFTLVTMDELLDRHERGLSLTRLVAITFDDGWAETCHPIAEICTRREWPVMIYAISSVVTRGGSLWFAELPILLREVLGHSLVYGGRELDFTGRKAASTTRALVRTLRAMPADRALRQVDALWAALGERAPAHGSAVFIDEHFVRRYANSPWVSFGAHTVDHQSLASQNEPAQIRQLVESKAVLADLTGRPVTHFCYPYGDPEAIGPVAPRLVRSVYRSATTMQRGVCSARSDAWYLPRISLYDSDSDARVLAKIALAGIV
jgi:peptidoglycan/xylan/chitin deacetylase (PgdA/CDA1 family)